MTAYPEEVDVVRETGMRRVGQATAAALALLVVTACGGSGGTASPSKTTSTSASPSQAASPTEDNGSAGGGSGGGGSGGGGGSADDATDAKLANDECAAIRAVQADLGGTAASAAYLAQFTLKMSSVLVDPASISRFQSKGDGLAAKACPAEHSTFLQQAKVDSLNAA